MEKIRPGDLKNATALAISRVAGTMVVLAAAAWVLLQVRRLNRLLFECEIFVISGKDWRPVLTNILYDGRILVCVLTGLLAVGTTFYIWCRAKRSTGILLATVAVSSLLLGIGSLYDMGMDQLKQAFAIRNGAA